MEQVLNQQLKRLEKQEQKILTQSDHTFINDKISPVMDKIQSKIPEKLIDVLDKAINKGFQLVFEKGSPYIERTYNKEKIELNHDINNYALNKKFSKEHIKRLDKQSKQSKLVNSTFSVLEGSILGLLGIGLPDIPLFLSVILRTNYEVALSYGYQCDAPEERNYMLLLICGAITKGEQQKEFDKILEQLGEKIDKNIDSNYDTEKLVAATSKVLSEALLTAKFIQGIPVVGVVGGVVNYNIVNRIAKYARIKYKKRYLHKRIEIEEFPPN
ncbi:MAG: hypothetical protein K0S01_525 [Herbinix sp.]|jgi:hypothetical protein|nr:hypothetical protein [Herbinix sp.]